ncbi:MAG: type II CAAX endopeptidase family protein [Enhygromyxa sp.]
MSDASQFRRGQHLLFAVLGLVAIAAVYLAGRRPAELLGASEPWDGADVLLVRMIFLLAAAVPTYLALVVVDTRSGVTVASRRWWDMGWEPWAILVGTSAAYVLSFHFAPHDAVVEHAQLYYSEHHDEFLGIAWGTLVAGTVAAVLAEELVFRVLLQRALEGYMREWAAVIVQAIVFQLVHMYVYGVSAANGGFVIAGVMFGIAFMRTRCLLAPLVLHLGVCLVHAAVFVAALD